MLAFIGLGGAGGNIADVASEFGFMAGAINFSQKDLDSLVNVKAKLRLLGSEGVGHNRDEAISLLADQYVVAVDFVKEYFNHHSIDVIAFAFSTGGGTGSGIAPMLIDICSAEMPDKTFIAIPILPDVTEATISQINCSKTFEELSSLDIAVFPIDNQKFRTLNEDTRISKGKLYENMNISIISLFKKLVDYTEKYSKNGNFDRKDLLTVLKTKGMGIVSEVNINHTFDGKIDMSRNGVSNNVNRSWERSLFAPIELSKVIRAGVIFDGEESLMEFIDYHSIFDCFENGLPIDLFEGNYHEDSGKITTILTGLSWCNTRLNQVEELISKNEHRINEVLQETENQSYTSKHSALATKIRQTPVKQQLVNDILTKYRNRK